MMVNVDQADKLAKFLAATSPQAGAEDNLYDIDLDVKKISAGNAQGVFFSILDCKEGTMLSNCACASDPWTLCC